MGNKDKFMDLNRETAMRLWNKSFGKETKVTDFSGRKIVKGAYNDRNSEFGWNVDHILPQSKGGVTADYNLICCHIKTNDEKADRFPCFTANKLKFEIIKVQNHYEIKSIDQNIKKTKEDDSEVNFYDSASGIRFYKDLKGVQNKPRFVGSILIRLLNVQNTAVIDFIEKFMDEENISYKINSNYNNSETRIIASNYNMPLKEDNAKLLDKCILLNTYLGYYFCKIKAISGYDIYYQVNYYKDKSDMYVDAQTINFNNINDSVYNDTLYINNLVIINTEAKNNVKEDEYDRYTEYDYVFTNLAKNLEKEASRD